MGAPGWRQGVSAQAQQGAQAEAEAEGPEAQAKAGERLGASSGSSSPKPGIADGAVQVNSDLSGVGTGATGAEGPGSELAAKESTTESSTSSRTENVRREAQADPQRALRAIDQVRVQLRPGQRSADIQLAPAELGRLSIRLRVERGNVHAVVRVEEPETLAALERFMPELRAALSAQGLDVGGMDLSLAGDADSSFAESFESSASGRHHEQGSSTEPTESVERQLVVPSLGIREDAVDTFA